MWMWKQSLDSREIRDEAEDFVAKKDRIPFLRIDPLECPLPPLRANWCGWCGLHSRSPRPRCTRCSGEPSHAVVWYGLLLSRQHPLT